MLVVGGEDGGACHCPELNGRIINIADAQPYINLPPLHPNCRCTIIPLAQNSMFADKNPEPMESDKSFEKWKEKNVINNKTIAKLKESDIIDNKPKAVCKIDFYDKKQINKVLTKYEKEWTNLDYEKDCTITSDGQVWITNGTKGIVHPELISTEFNVSLKDSYSYHNHPKSVTRYSFSGEDIGFFLEHEIAYSKASDDKFEYEMQRTGKTKRISYDDAMREFKRTFKNDIYSGAMDENLNVDEDGYHKTTDILSKTFRFKYRRKLK